MTAPRRTRSDEHAAYQYGSPTAVIATEPENQDSNEQKFSLSATQVAASMTAAVTAALVGSRLGVAGTVIGAGLASVISVVGGAIIGHSILLTRKQVKRAVLQVRGTDPSGNAVEQLGQTVVLPSARSVLGPADDHTVVIPAVTRLDLQRASRDARPGPGNAEPGRPHPTRPGLPRDTTGLRPGSAGATGPVPPKTRRRLSTGVLLGVAASLTIFVSALGAVTVAETIKGSPLGGGESGGLTVLGGNGGSPIGSTTTSVAVVTEAATLTQTVTTEVTAPATTVQSPAAQSAATKPQSPSPSPSPSVSAPAQTPASAGAPPAAAVNSALPSGTASAAVPTGEAASR